MASQLIEICFFRYKTLYFKDYVSGAKSCIELIAVYAANQEDKMETKSYLRTFERFINYLVHFDNLDIHFEKNGYQILDKKQPRVIDPVNPYNNLAKNWDQASIRLVKQYANETKRRLNILASSRMALLNSLFEPQPVFRTDMREIFRTQHWLVGQTATVSMLPDLKIRNEYSRTDYKLWKGLEILKVYFQLAICISRASGSDESQINETIKNTISKQVHNADLPWGPAENEKHEDYDVTFTIPTSNQKAIRISYRL